MPFETRACWHHSALLWMRSTYSSMHDFKLKIVGLISIRPYFGQFFGDDNADYAFDLTKINIYYATRNSR